MQSTLERLYRKKLLKRFKASHAFRYAPQVAREQLVAGLVNEVRRYRFFAGCVRRSGELAERGSLAYARG